MKPTRRYALIFLGPPGAGKGTQARKVAEAFGIPHISSGDILRDQVARGTPLGLLAKDCMNRGELVSDPVVSEMVRERLSGGNCRQGFLLDGYPRTLTQALSFQRFLQTQGCIKPIVVNLQLGYNVIVQRLSGRRICPVCQRTYNLNSQPPRQDNVCDDDGSPLRQRPDDREEAIRERLVAYERQTAPLVEYYRNEGSVIDLDGDRQPEEITEELIQRITSS